MTRVCVVVFRYYKESQGAEIFKISSASAGLIVKLLCAVFDGLLLKTP